MPNMGQPLSIETETRIVALLARGDKYEEIRQQIEGGVSDMAIRAVKKRNKDNLAIITERMLIKAAEDAGAIKQKANKLISASLDKADVNVEIVNKAHADWLKDEITWQEYEKILKHYKVITLSELVNVSKEMHNQESAAEKTPASAADMTQLIAAIRSGDEVSITKAVFNVKSD